VQTFTEPRQLEANPHFAAQRIAALAGLASATLDRPLVTLVQGFADLPWCFPMQSCCGHFVFLEGQDRRNLDRLPPTASAPARVLYRLAYLVLALDDGPEGQALLRQLRAVPAIAPDLVQFGSADWFWERQLNTFVLQVQPWRHRQVDSVLLTHDEAQEIEQTRDWFFMRLGEVLREQREVAP
jgi:hypothetical protein